jgi:hypothetical protein
MVQVGATGMKVAGWMDGWTDGRTDRQIDKIFIQLMKIFPDIHGTRRLIAVCTRDRHWSLQ